MRFAPRPAIFESFVVDLIDRRTVVTVGLEMLRQRNAVWLSGAEVSHQVPNLGRIRSQACHDRRARGTANRLLAVSSIEHNAASCNAIDVWALDDRIAVTAKFGSQVVYGNKQNVGLVRGEQRRCRQESYCNEYPLFYDL